MASTDAAAVTRCESLLVTASPGVASPGRARAVDSGAGRQTTGSRASAGFGFVFKVDTGLCFYFSKTKTDRPVL